MADVALTAIKHGKEDGSVVEYAEGETVKKNDFSDDEYDALKESGAVGPAPRPVAEDEDEDTDALKARIAELEAEVAAAKIDDKPQAPVKAAAPAAPKE